MDPYMTPSGEVNKKFNWACALSLGGVTYLAYKDPHKISVLGTVVKYFGAVTVSTGACTALSLNSRMFQALKLPVPLQRLTVAHTALTLSGIGLRIFFPTRTFLTSSLICVSNAYIAYELTKRIHFPHFARSASAPQEVYESVVSTLSDTIHVPQKNREFGNCLFYHMLQARDLVSGKEKNGPTVKFHCLDNIKAHWKEAPAAITYLGLYLLLQSCIVKSEMTTLLDLTKALKIGYHSLAHHLVFRAGTQEFKMDDAHDVKDLKAPLSAIKYALLSLSNEEERQLTLLLTGGEVPCPTENVKEIKKRFDECKFTIENTLFNTNRVLEGDMPNWAQVYDIPESQHCVVCTPGNGCNPGERPPHSR
jgi:hypothetical protein